MEPVEEYWSVEEWLDGIGMKEYSQAFIDNGYETVELVCKIGVEDLDEIGVTEKRHRGILLTHAELLLKETSGSPQPSPKPVITVTMNQKTPSPVAVHVKKDSEGYSEPWANKSPTPVSTPGPQDYCEPWSSIPLAMPPAPSLSTIPNNNIPTGDYAEPWDNKPTSSPLLSPSEYSEPWTGNQSTASPSHVSDITDGRETKPPPLPPPNKPKSPGRKPPPSPKAKLPDYKRDENEKGLTKLQLKLKIRTELSNDAIVLSEHPYCNENGQVNEALLLDLAETYAERFGVESLNVYDALTDLWRVSNTSAELATPIKPILQGGPSDNYDEPFDTAVKPSPPMKAVSAGSSKELKSSGKSQTLPLSQVPQTYEEPFDTINTSPKDSPKKEQFKTMPSPSAHPQKSLTDPSKKENAPTRGFSKFLKRSSKARAQSVKEESPLDDAGNDKKSKSKSKQKKRLSSDETEGRSSKGSKSIRASIAGLPVSKGKSAHKAGSIDSSSGPSEVEESPSQKKRHSGNVFSKFITPPQERRDAQGNEGSGGSDSDTTPPALRKLKALGNNRLAGSDRELNKDDNDSPRWMVTSRSFDNLAETQDDAKPVEKKGFFKRLLTLRRSIKPKKSKESPVMRQRLTVADRESTLTASISMPDIAAMTVLKNVPPAISEEPIPKHSPIPQRPSTDRDSIIPITTSAPIDIKPPDKNNEPLPVTLTPSNGSVKSLGKPAPPPKPATLTRRTRTPDSSSAKTPTSGSDLERSGESTKPPLKPARVASDGNVRMGSGSSNTLPLKPTRRSNEQLKASEEAKKAISTENVSSTGATPTESRVGPPKPARRSLKHSGVTEQRKKLMLDNKNEEVASKTPEASTKPVEGTKPKEPSAKAETDSKALESSKSESPKSEQKPPPKPSRNYKTVRILPMPPAKAKPSKTESTESKTESSESTSNGSVKPSEVLKRNQSLTEPSKTATKSGEQPLKSGERPARSSAPARERQLPKPRPKVETPKKPSPPKPPRKSIKLKNVE